MRETLVKDLGEGWGTGPSSAQGGGTWRSIPSREISCRGEAIEARRAYLPGGRGMAGNLPFAWY
jgi:hypothetical protein